MAKKTTGKKPPKKTDEKTTDKNIQEAPVAIRKRPPPPTILCVAGKKIWKETANGEAVDFFNTAALRALLLDYCRHRVEVDAISKQVKKLPIIRLKKPEDARHRALLLRMRDTEARGAADKATKMRLTNQSRYTPQSAGTAGNKSTEHKPWLAKPQK